LQIREACPVAEVTMLEQSREQRDRNAYFFSSALLLFTITRLLRFSFGHKLTLSFAVQSAALVIQLCVLAHPHQSSSLGGCNGSVRGPGDAAVLLGTSLDWKAKTPTGLSSVIAIAEF